MLRPAAALASAALLLSSPQSAEARKVPASSLPAGKAAPFLSLEQVDEVLASLAQSYPKFVAGPVQIGTSVENRPIRALCVGACASFDTPAALLTGLVHGREPLGMMVSLTYAERLLALGKAGDETALSILSTRRLVVVPVVNPDAYAWNTESAHYRAGGARMARKNRRPGCANGRYADLGVDLNRNFDFYWDHDDVGSCPQPCSEDYRGTSAMSEPEAQALADLVQRSNLSIALNYHSYGRFINLPYGVQSLGAPPPEQYAVYLSLARGFAAATGGAYDYGHPWSGGLYSVNGDASDWMFGKHGVWAMSPELGPAFNDPFEDGMWPATEATPALTAEGLAISEYAVLAAGPLLEVSAAEVAVKTVTKAEDASCPGTCVRAELGVTLRNAGVKDSVGDVAVAFVPFSSQPNSETFCEGLADGGAHLPGSNSCAQPWHALGANVCEAGATAHAGQPAAFCPAGIEHTKRVPFNLEPLANQGAGPAAGKRGLSASLAEPSVLADAAPAVEVARRVRETVETQRLALLEQHAGAATDGVAVDKMDEAAMKAARRGLQNAVEAAEAHVAAAGSARRAAGVGDAADAPAVAAVFAEPAGPAATASGSVPGLTYISPGTLFSGLKVGHLPAQRHTNRIALQATSFVSEDIGDTSGASAAQVAAAKCKAATSGYVRAACGVKGDQSRWMRTPPIGFLAVSDELHCNVYTVACTGEVELLHRTRSSCMPCAALRNRQWESLLRPGRVNEDGYVVARVPGEGKAGSPAAGNADSGTALDPSMPWKSTTVIDVSWPWTGPDTLAPAAQLAVFFVFVVIGVVSVFRFMRTLGQHSRRARLASPRQA